MTIKKVNLIGYKLDNSLSWHIHNKIYEYLNLDLKYENLEFTSKEELVDFLNQKFNEDWFISNVTYPYKNFVYDYAIQNGFKIDNRSKFSQGCNFINVSNKTVYNLDGLGAVYSLNKHNINIKKSKVLILGSGITAKSIAYSLLKSDVSKVSITTRNTLDKNINKVDIVDYGSLDNCIHQFDVIINTVPPNVDIVNSFNMSKIKQNAFLMDISSFNNKTTFVAAAKQIGYDVCDGRSMVVAQAIYGIQEICRFLKVDNPNVDNFEKLYNIAMDEVRL